MGGLADLGINLSELLAQLVNFGILFGLLYLVAYKPVMRMMDERARKVKEGLEQAEAAKQAAVNAEEEVRKQLGLASQEAQERVSRAIRAGEELKQKAHEDARREAQALAERARADIRRERDDAIGEIRREFADLTILAAEKVVDRSLDKKAHRELIEKVLEESAALKE
ncbi:MAG: F0F1 ATP synthase subunit B [Chloroflexi bacterium]|nr:F0F1 ATP synthase subunit B [Chloroflexota bacterium]